MHSKNVVKQTSIIYKEAILETLPVPNEIKGWCKSHPNFFEALKSIYSNRFIHLSSLVVYPKHKILGIFSYDYQLRNPVFKQDFIEIDDDNNETKTFTLYTAYVRKKGVGTSRWVKDINSLFNKYHDLNQGTSSHHLTLSELLQIEGFSKKFKDRAIWAVKKGDQLKKNGLRSFTEDELSSWTEQIKNLKTDRQWYLVDN